MKFAVHYGCHMMRPGHALKNDDPLDPKKFDNLIRTLGGESMDYMTKLTCCGQGLDRVDQHENALTMARLKLKELKMLGADAMVFMLPVLLFAVRQQPKPHGKRRREVGHTGALLYRHSWPRHGL